MPQWRHSCLKPLYLRSATKQKRSQPLPCNCPCVLRTTRNFTKKLDAFDPSKIVEVVTQTVAGGYQKSFQKPNTYQNSNNPFIPSQQRAQASQSTNPLGKPYLGMISNSSSVNMYIANPNWISYAQQSCAKLLPKLSAITLWSKQWLHALK